MRKNIFSNTIFRIVLLIIIIGLGFHYTSALKTPQKENTSVSAKVLYVIDGDTIDVSIDGKKERIRLIGIDAPEMAHEEKPAECLSTEATSALEQLVDTKTVELVQDPTQSDRDEYNRLLRYVFIPEERLINAILLSQGYAREYTFKGVPYRYQKEFQEAEVEAKKAKKGIFSDSACR